MTSSSVPSGASPAIGLSTAGAPRAGGALLRQRSIPYLFLAPFLIFFLVFFIVPIFYALYLSVLQDIPGSVSRFVGLDHYKAVLQDGQFWTGVWRMVIFGIVQVPVMLGLALLFALLLDSAIVRFKTLFRLGFFMPYAIPGVVAALLWGFLYSREYGPLASITNSLHGTAPDFLSVNTLLWSIANIITWTWTGYNMIIMYAALQAIPRDLYEAAGIDGCTGLQVAWHVKIPILRPALVLTCVFSIIGTLQLFNEPQLLQSCCGAPVDTSYTPNLYAYNFVSFGAYNQVAAIAFVLTVITGGALVRLPVADAPRQYGGVTWQQLRFSRAPAPRPRRACASPRCWRWRSCLPSLSISCCRWSGWLSRPLRVRAIC